MKEDGACMQSAKGRALLDVWIGLIAGQLNLNGAYDEKLWVPRSGGRCLLNVMRCEPQRGYNDIETINFYKCPGLFPTATAE